MWPFRRSGIPTYEVDNIVGEGTDVRGDLRGPGGFRIDGLVTGSIEAEGPIVIGEKGAVDGTVKGRDVVVLGRVHGNVTAAAHLEIGPEGRVIGDVDVVSLKVHPGGVFHGASRIGDAGEGVARLPAPRANESMKTNTSSFGILPVGSLTSSPSSQKAKGGRTLPPPLGAVPPPATGAFGSQPQLPVVAPPAPAVSTVERIAGREPEAANTQAPKAAAND